ncbi:MAG: S-layer homology domain-containing protein, partial [SAR324 cluster bacterium]|nr:S-layer homology domain-containing protein [SAR324 cluster bacterium]
MDTPSFHVKRGDDALMNSQYEAARSAYKKALSLDGNYSPALSGLAAATAYEASRPGVSNQTKNQVLTEADSQIEKALDKATSSADQSRAHSFAMQVYLSLQLPEEEWYVKVKDHFEEALDLTPNDPTPIFFMARAEAAGYNYDQAALLYQKVLQLGGTYEARANKELKQIQRIQRALPGSDFGKRIANVGKITRADIAGLFIVELKLNTLYRNQQQKQQSGYQVPKSQQKLNMDPLEKYPDAVDISGHALEDAIKEVMALGIKGLAADPSHKFYPDQEFKRAEFAQLLQDLLIKITRDPSLATRFIGEPSPFPDVSPDVWYYNAVRTVVNRGMMQVNNIVTGNFSPLSPVSGADALLAIRNLKEILKELI